VAWAAAASEICSPRAEADIVTYHIRGPYIYAPQYIVYHTVVQYTYNIALKRGGGGKKRKEKKRKEKKRKEKKRKEKKRKEKKRKTYAVRRDNGNVPYGLNVAQGTLHWHSTSSWSLWTQKTHSVNILQSSQNSVVNIASFQFVMATWSSVIELRNACCNDVSRTGWAEENCQSTHEMMRLFRSACKNAVACMIRKYFAWLVMSELVWTAYHSKQACTKQ